MPVTEFMLQNIADKMFRFILSHNYNQEKIAKTSGYDIDIIKQSLRHALSKSFEKFEERHPQWTALLLDSDFFDKEGIPILAQLLLQNSYPIISELAVLWLQKANLVHPEWYISSTREIEPIAADFLDYFIQSLASTDVMDMLHNDQTLRKAIDEIAAIRGKLRANLSTPGTRRDYLDWLINFTMYIDAQGTTHEERLSLQIKLANVYVLLDTEPASELDLVKNEITFKSDNLMEQEEVLKVSEAVNRFDHLVLLGDPGSGKTTLLHYLAHQHAQSLLSRSTDPQTLPGTPLFPILLPISDYAEHGLPQNQTLNDFLAQACIMHHCPFAGLEDLLTTALAQETCLILLDGLDEVLDTEMHSRVVEQIDHFVNSYAHRPHRFLITSRRTGYSFHPLGAPFVHYRLCDMDESQIRQFLESWCLAVEAAQTPELSASLRQARARREVEGILHAIHTSPVVQHLASNPLMLRIIALIHREVDKLPRKRVKLYEQATTTLTQTWRAQPSLGETQLTMMEDVYFDPLLSYLAFWIHMHRLEGQVTEEEIHQVLREEWLRIKETISEEDEPA